jgi:hypothetical protein
MTIEFKDLGNIESFYSNMEEPREESLDDDEVILDTNCPKCHREYDEIDYEYQICHYCNYENKQ